MWSRVFNFGGMIELPTITADTDVIVGRYYDKDTDRRMKALYMNIYITSQYT